MAKSSKCFQDRCAGLKPPKGIWCHITGTDLVRDGDGTVYVLEDNLRCPSGVSYVLENREVMKRTFPQMFDGLSILPVEDYPGTAARRCCNSSRRRGRRDPTVVVLTPGIYNSAYFEHCFLAQQMGVELVQGRDLVVERRICLHADDAGAEARRRDLSPHRRRFSRSATRSGPTRLLGVPGLMDVYRAGQVALANAPGTGIADDKAVYAYVPQIIKYYLGEDILLPNVPTFICGDDKQRQHVLANLDKLVVKPTNESGGYGIMLGPRASQAEREKCRGLIRGNPRNYVAQPMLSLSRVPTIVGDHLEGAARRLAALYSLWRGHLLLARRTDPRGAGQGFAGGQFVAGRRQQRHVGDEELTAMEFPRPSSRRTRGHLVPGGRMAAMLSRVADSVFWMSRYVERAENVARFMDVNLNLTLDLGAGARQPMGPLIYTTGDHEAFYSIATTTARQER